MKQLEPGAGRPPGKKKPPQSFDAARRERKRGGSQKQRTSRADSFCQSNCQTKVNKKGPESAPTGGPASGYGGAVEGAARKENREFTPEAESLNNFQNHFDSQTILAGAAHVVEFVDPGTGQLCWFTIRDGKSVSLFDNGRRDSNDNVILEDYHEGFWFIQQRRELYQLAAIARKILFPHVNKRGKRFGCIFCRRKLAKPGQGVTVRKTEKRAYFGNLKYCASPWLCPLCADKISAYREQEIAAAIDRHTANGFFPYMLVLTFSHSRTDLLVDLIPRLRRAMKLFKGCRAYRDIMSRLKNRGTIRALEDMYGTLNGHHPHFHELLFLELLAELTEAERIQIEDELFPLWCNACVKAGLGAPDRKHGISLSPSWSSAQYLAKHGRKRKWGAHKELARAMQKKSNSPTIERFSPWDMLRVIDQMPESSLAQILIPAFVDYAQATLGMHQIQWSRGLKAHFGIESKSDEEIADDKEDQAVKLYLIQDHIWHQVVLPGSLQTKILEAAETEGSQGVERIITEYQKGHKAATANT